MHSGFIERGVDSRDLHNPIIILPFRMQEVIPGFLNRKEMPDLFTDALIQGTQNIGTQRNEKKCKKTLYKKRRIQIDQN